MRVLVLLAACSSAPARAPAPSPSPAASFDPVAAVLTSPRCVNCHPADDSPRQGDGHLMHDPPVTRGADDRGVPALRCTTCHQEENATLARIPGAHDWRLAPREMAWLGKTPGEICRQISDPARNGHRTLAQIEDHIAHDGLVAWGWAPGADRTPAIGTQAQAAAAFHAWAIGGAACP